MFEVDVSGFEETGNTADCIGNEPLYHDDLVIGWVTSGGYGHHSKKSLALGYVPTALARPDVSAAGFEIEIVGRRCPALRLDTVPFDPDGDRLRS